MFDEIREGVPDDILKARDLEQLIDRFAKPSIYVGSC